MVILLIEIINNFKNLNLKTEAIIENYLYYYLLPSIIIVHNYYYIIYYYFNISYAYE
jgi:hypothetical protein